jgi:dienelactone hydrolase
VKKQLGSTHPHHEIERYLPLFREARLAQMGFPLAFDPERHPDFNAWRTQARETLIEHLGPPPPRADFDPVIIAEEEREGYAARKILFNVSGFSRIAAYLLIPGGSGPFPAVLALHDHGARFSIGKEKVIKPIEAGEDVLADAKQWVAESYGGRFFGDELARRGYVVLAIDALFWSERGQLEDLKSDGMTRKRERDARNKAAAEFHDQQKLASNLFQMGMSWCGLITWDDIRSAEFLATLPEVNEERVAAMGLSVGAHRTWMLAAATDRIKAGAAICWMATTHSLQVPGNNQTGGDSSYSMALPGLRNHLDYPDVASIACPKPMLFYNGLQDSLFPVEGVEAAYAKMRKVWENQAAREHFEAKLWDTPHQFSPAMQEEAFRWLHARLGQGMSR